jgi:PKD repeat protein
MPRRIFAAVTLLILPQIARATILTNSRPGIAQMAGYWEADSVQISSLVNSNYPAFTNNWEYMQASTGNTAADGDEHINMTLTNGTGATGNNLGTESPLVAEIINAAGTLLPTGNTHAKSRGIFRYYHEHANEVKYEIHPILERDTWDGSAFVLANDYHNNIRPVADATTKAISTYTDIVQGNNQSVTVAVSNDNVHVMITFPTSAGADTVNYLQYDGQVVQTLTNDSVSSYITFHATNSPAGAISGARVMRCRIITNTVAATVAATLGSNQTVTVNILNRVDMMGISNVVASLGAGQSTSLVQPLEWITLGLTNIGPNVPPSAYFSGTPTNGTASLSVTFSDTSAGNITNRFWDFGDTGTTNVTTNSVVHVYQAAGTNTVKLLVSGPGGSSTNTRSGYIVVVSGGPPPPPVASFSGSPTNGTAQLAVAFTDTSTGSVTNRFWDFGDTTTTNISTNGVSHIYAAGTYNVTLIVSGAGGSSTNSKPSYITATIPPPVASFSGSPTNGTDHLLVTFADTSLGSISNRFWDFGDSSTTNVTTNSVAHTYAAGTYDVALIVSGSGGSGTNSQPNYITVLTAFQSWQMQYFTSINDPSAAPDADPDGDGCNNLCEFLSGTDPLNRASGLRITSVVATDDNVVVTWATALGHTNVVQANTGLPDGSYTTNFTDLSPLIIMDPGTGDFTTNYTDPGGATNLPARYYRIRLQP